MKCRVLESKNCIITNPYSNKHNAVDICKNTNGKADFDYIVAHSDGKIIFFQDGLGHLPGTSDNSSYGNCVKIDHGNGYCTLYAHMKKGLLVKNGQTVKTGQKIGYMGNSGNTNGAHLHFEVWKDGKRINPTEYLDKDLPIIVTTKYKKGDIVNINGVYVSSTSNNKLRPTITKGKITDIVVGARNPYLLDDGNIGWVNDECIVADSVKYLSNKNYKGVSIVAALKQIKVDSSYNYRSKLAKVNGINNYRGTAEQNIFMLSKLQNGTLKSV